MRTYGEFCSIAKALDVVGDRWTLLIVRELWIRGAARYTDLRNGLPGIATNLLSDRLRQLEQAGLIVSEEAPPPVATPLFSLTDRGRALEPVLDALGAWGKWELRKPAAEDEAFLTHWLTFPLSHRFEDAEPEGPPVVVELRTGDAPLLIELAGGELDVGSRRASDPDADVIL